MSLTDESPASSNNEDPRTPTVAYAKQGSQVRVDSDSNTNKQPNLDSIPYTPLIPVPVEPPDSSILRTRHCTAIPLPSSTSSNIPELAQNQGPATTSIQMERKATMDDNIQSPSTVHDDNSFVSEHHPTNLCVVIDSPAAVATGNTNTCLGSNFEKNYEIVKSIISPSNASVALPYTITNRKANIQAIDTGNGGTSGTHPHWSGIADETILDGDDATTIHCARNSSALTTRTLTPSSIHRTGAYVHTHSGAGQTEPGYGDIQASGNILPVVSKSPTTDVKHGQDTFRAELAVDQREDSANAPSSKSTPSNRITAPDAPTTECSTDVHLAKTVQRMSNISHRVGRCTRNATTTKSVQRAARALALLTAPQTIRKRRSKSWKLKKLNCSKNLRSKKFSKSVKSFSGTPPKIGIPPSSTTSPGVPSAHPPTAPPSVPSPPHINTIHSGANTPAPTLPQIRTDTPVLPVINSSTPPAELHPADSCLNGQPFKPKVRPPISQRMTRKLLAAAKLCRYNHKTSIKKLCSIVPKVSPFRFAAALTIAISQAPAHIKPDFSAVELFKLSEGSETIRTKDARDLFELLFVGLGSFPIGCDELEWSIEPIVNKNPKNLIVHAGKIPGVPVPPSTITGKQRMLDLASVEVSAKRYLGPFTIAEILERYGEGVVVSQGFIIAKPKAISTAFRLVHNASSLKGNINGSMPDSDYQVRLDHTSKYLEFVRAQLHEAAGAPIFQVVADVSKCYRRMGIRVTDRPRYGLRIDIDADGEVPFFSGDTDSVTTRQVLKGEMMVFIDTRLPFGASSSVTSCVRVTNYMRDIMRELLLGQPGTCAAYIDDFAIVGQRTTVDLAILHMRQIMQRVGLPENIKKQQDVSQLSIFLGIEYDLSVPSMSLPAKKQRGYLRHVEHFLQRDTTTIKRSELESLVGKLAHCACIFSQARIYYQRLLAALRKAKRGKSTTINLGTPEMDDLRWWRSLLKEHTGTVILDTDGWQGLDVHKIYTDASTSTGFGCMYKGLWFNGTWNDDITAAIAAGDVDINLLELICLTMSLETFGHQLRGKRILFRCDNSSCVHNIQKESSQKRIRATILRRLYVVAALFGIQLRSTWIPTDFNEHADALSRSDMQRFFSLPQSFDLQQVLNPCLQSMDLLVNPDGQENPSSPAWLQSNVAVQLQQSMMQQ